MISLSIGMIMGLTVGWILGGFSIEYFKKDPDWQKATAEGVQVTFFVITLIVASKFL